MNIQPLIPLVVVILLIPGIFMGGASALVTPDMRSTCQIAVDRMPVWNLTPDQAALLLEGSNPVSKGMHILDLRSPGEFALSHIPGAEQVNPEPESVKKALLKINSTNPVFMYGGNGADSQLLITVCEDAGCSGVFYLIGGFTAWNTSFQTTTT
ncbi:MAG TPA: rhodanese-like domain-containing protein [Methanospirillum sp.]|nr:rhodanese-like domain-containing protein [Methanospirillum sp.]